MRVVLRILVGVAVVGCIVLAGGFVWFAVQSSQPAGPLPSHADGIVALTGGPGRVETALHLLAEGRANRLLITGIGGGADLPTLGHLTGIDVDVLAPRITLGRYAASTRGNGVETAAWAEQYRIVSLIVVTAGYHMPRALIELHAALPGVTLYPVAVQTPDRPVGAPRPGLRLEAEEYAKFLFTLSGLSEWLPRRESTADVPSRAEVQG
jgi:uncharacterized SAM-binding protein YcdF (DUF218 family)